MASFPPQTAAYEIRRDFRDPKLKLGFFAMVAAEQKNLNNLQDNAKWWQRAETDAALSMASNRCQETRSYESGKKRIISTANSISTNPFVPIES